MAACRVCQYSGQRYCDMSEMEAACIECGRGCFEDEEEGE